MGGYFLLVLKVDLVSIGDSAPLPPFSAADTARRRRYLAVMGVEQWVPRMPGTTVRETPAVYETTPATESTLSAVAYEKAPDVALALTPPIVAPHAAESAMDWDVLEQTVRDCTACPLHRTRTQGVFGVGDRAARWFIVGEAPGEEEDRQGQPFVGRAGQLLDRMLRGIGLQREEVYIANVLKSRPPGNRTPSPTETTACLSYLKRQIELVDPRIIVATGTVAAQNLLTTTASIGTLRGRLHRYGARRIPLVATYHPAYLLRSPSEKRKAWDDLRLAWRVFHCVPPDGQDL